MNDQETDYLDGGRSLVIAALLIVLTFCATMAVMGWLTVKLLVWMTT